MAEESTIEKDERLQPGDGNAADLPRDQWKPCGKAEGVIFLGDVGASPGYERQALRYLRDPDTHPESKRFKERNEGQIGLCVPQISFLLNRNPKIFEKAEEEGRPIERLFISSKAGINANLGEHAKRWRVVPVEEGVWVVLYV